MIHNKALLLFVLPILSCSHGLVVRVPDAKPTGKTFQYLRVDHKSANKFAFSVYEGPEAKGAFDATDAYTFNESFPHTANELKIFTVIDREAPVPATGTYKIEVVMTNHIVAPGYAGFTEFYFTVVDPSGARLHTERFSMTAVHPSPSSTNIFGSGAEWAKQSLLYAGLRRMLIVAMKVTLGETVPPLPQKDGENVTYCAKPGECLALMPGTMVATRCISVHPSGQCARQETRTASNIKWTRGYKKHTSLPDWAQPLSGGEPEPEPIVSDKPQTEKPAEKK